MSPGSLIVMILSIGLVTYAIRVSFFLLSGRVELPEVIKSGLQFIPAAVLTALIIPALAQNQGVVQLSWQNPRLIAGLLAIAVAYKTKNVLLTLAVGMAVLWVLQTILG
jgi:branched-subunit amino acid transport protein